MRNKRFIFSIRGPHRTSQDILHLFNRSAHSAGPEFRIWSSEPGITGPRDCPQTVYMLQINADWTRSGAQALLGIIDDFIVVSIVSVEGTC